jgi:hypothetical protein
MNTSWKSVSPDAVRGFYGAQRMFFIEPVPSSGPADRLRSMVDLIPT